ncbi:S-adenosylmethionine decarboxylase proenzyme [Clarias magur]|uniref:S-adenosylmethionine decarboxylase proenzyme n=1 Tax=Clarias magur TaxID=1594786 RepID=A0A8J4UM08_CLAMG|nr:S-adenosylmethionine decarboxylase proenzyme [Clarias magur]
MEDAGLPLEPNHLKAQWCSYCVKVLYYFSCFPETPEDQQALRRAFNPEAESPHLAALNLHSPLTLQLEPESVTWHYRAFQGVH